MYNILSRQELFYDSLPLTYQFYSKTQDLHDS